MKNIKHLLAILLALCLVFALCACSGDSGETNETSTAPSDGSTEETQESTEETVSGTVYTVKVADEAGNPISGAMVQMCQGGNCMPMATNAEGVAVYTMQEEADYEVKFVTLPTGYDYTTQETVFHFADGSFELTITLKAVA